MTLFDTYTLIEIVRLVGLLVTAVAATIYFQSVSARRARARGRPLPPGPTPLPIIGNLLDMPRVRPWVGLRDFCVKYGECIHPGVVIFAIDDSKGDVLRLRIFDKEMLIVNSPDVIFEYLDRRSANTSGRPVGPTVSLCVHLSRFILV